LAGEIWLPEKTIEDQVERAMFEMQRNWSYYLGSHPWPKVRNTRFNQERLTAVCAEMKSKMLEDVKHGSRPPQADIARGLDGICSKRDAAQIGIDA
jgi:hypothetical protein